MLQRWARGALDLFFPRSCVGCRAEGAYLCPRCLSQVPRLAPPWCAACGVRLGALPARGRSVSPVSAGRCRTCRSYPLDLDGIRSAFPYQPPVSDAIIQFKYHGLRALGQELASTLVEALPSLGFVPDVVVPVPLHVRRKRERGYNQAEVLATVLGALLGLPLAADALRRVRETAPQARLHSREERMANVAAAFGPGPGSVHGRRVLLVDDVCTTGATLSACGHVLRRQGAAAVWALTVAREE